MGHTQLRTEYKNHISTTNSQNTLLFEMASSSHFILAVVACSLLQYSAAYSLEEVEVEQEPSFVYVEPEESQIYYHQRFARSLQPGAPNFPVPGQQNEEGWKFDPSLTRGEDGNTKTSINVQHTGPNHKVGANWDKVIRGPGRAKPTYSIRGSWKW